MKLETNLSQTLKQKQKLSLQQRYALRVLAMSDTQLEREIEQMVESNPLLDVEDYNYNTSNQGDVYERASAILSQPQTLSDVLFEQLHICSYDIPYPLASFLIESLDGNGYLQLSTQEIATLTSYDEDKIEECIALLQTFEPYGVFARNLQETLLIQLCVEDVPFAQVALMIVNYHMQDLANNRVVQIAELLQIDISSVNHAIVLIRSLQPKPGAAYSSNAMIARVDAKIEVKDASIHIDLTSQQYRFHINETYASIKDDVALAYIKKHIQEANMFITSLQKRNITLAAIITCICEHQRDFFLHHGEMKALTLHDIAQDLSLHESTVSRGVSQKMIEFEEHNIALKECFPTRLENGQSSSATQRYIQQLIQQENPKKPLSDQQLSNLLEKQNIKISRRTVSKYREQMKIPVTTLRKKYE